MFYEVLSCSINYFCIIAVLFCFSFLHKNPAKWKSAKLLEVLFCLFFVDFHKRLHLQQMDSKQLCSRSVSLSEFSCTHLHVEHMRCSHSSCLVKFLCWWADLLGNLHVFVLLDYSYHVACMWSLPTLFLIVTALPVDRFDVEMKDLALHRLCMQMDRTDLLWPWKGAPMEDDGDLRMGRKCCNAAE